MSTLASFAEAVVSRLVWTSVQATLLIGLVWLIGRQLPRLSAATRSLLWWLLGVQLLLGIALPTPVSLPLLSPTPVAEVATPPTAPAPAATREHRIGGFGPSFAGASTDAFVAVTAPSASPLRAAPTTTTPWRWPLVVLALWLAGLIAQMLIAGRQWREARAIVRASRPLDDHALQATGVTQARMLGLRRCPELRVSDAIRSPQVSGLWHPIVLLPTQQHLSTEDASLALAHELTHLRRGDLWMGWLPALAQRLFFFHPLVAWAMREYALHREAACDAQVLQQNSTAPQDYGRLLLRLGVAHPLHAGLAGASPTFHNLKRRLTMLQHSAQDTTSRVRSWLLVALIATVGVLPYRVTQATPDKPTQPGAASPAASSTVTTRATPATAPAQWIPPAPTVPPTPPTPPAPPKGPVAPPTPAAPPIPPVNGGVAHHIDIDTHGDNGYGFALIDSDAITINANYADMSALEGLRQRGEPLLWFRHGKQAYVIRDQGYVQRAKAAFAPVAALGKEQGKLGGEQGRLGGEQGRLGGEQGRLGAREGALGMRQAALATREAEIDAMAAEGKSADSIASARASLKASTDAIDKERAELEHQQDALAKQQEALGQKQEALGQEQEALGERQEKASAAANQQLSRILDEAIAKGLAQPFNR